MKYIALDADSYSHDNNDGDDSGEAYSYRGTTTTTWNIHGLSLNDNDSYRAIPVEDCNVGDKLFAVVAIYSTGDSFGSDEGSEIELVSVHKNADLAKKNCDAINTRKRDSPFSIELDNGKIITRYCPWDGYFESLDSCEWNEYLVK